MTVASERGANPEAEGHLADGGGGVDSTQGWFVVTATFVSTFTVFGIAYSFGAFFDSMAEDFGTGKGATALMFSITTAWYFSLGLVAGRVADRVGPRPLLITAAIALGVGLLATSRVDSIWLGYATYGLGAGTAVACAYVPMVAAVGGWFVRRRTGALGIAVAGIGVGTLVIAPLSEHLIEEFGWRTAYVVLGIGGSAVMLLASLGACRPPPASQAGPPPSLRAIARSRPFVILYASSVLLSLSLFVPFVFLKDYSEEVGITSGGGAALVGFIGAASIVGRLGMGALGSRLGPLRLMQGSFAVMTLSFVVWLIADGSYGLLVLFAVALGVGYGGFIALSPAVVAILFGTAGLGAILGALYTSAAIGGLIGPPVAGEIIDRTSYDTAISVALVATATSTGVLLLLSRRARER